MNATDDSSHLVWHYTTSSGLLGMIQHRELWATHSQFMNDRVEGSVMHSAIAAFLSNTTTLTSPQMNMVEMQYSFLTTNKYPNYTRVPQGNMFLVCGSRDNDALTLWRNYAREAVSFAVGLDPNVPLGVITSNQSSPGNWHDVTSWHDVDYASALDSIPRHHRERLISAARSEDPGDQIVNVSLELQRILSGVKHNAFVDERETRVAFFNDNTRDWKFRAGRFGLTPYLRIGTSEQWGRSSNGEENLPIRAIRVSANATDGDIMAVHALLEGHGFTFGEIYADRVSDDGALRPEVVDYEDPIPVVQSQHPLRW
ncbi:hypothetical protein [Brachybacterium alimentarium]|uniref:hypothetical protein n=1 Tax=Brachybacterium alimentarium TaxID=47845 RepID=UPI003FD06FA8